MCRVKEDLSRSDQLVGYFYIMPPIGVSYCLAKRGLTGTYSVPALTDTLPHLFASDHVSAADTLTLLIKASTTVTVYRGWHRTLFFLPGINSLFIMCIGIMRNNSLVGGRARAEAQNLATERTTLYCTRLPSALTTRPHGQVLARVNISRYKFEI